MVPGQVICASQGRVISLLAAICPSSPWLEVYMRAEFTWITGPPETRMKFHVFARTNRIMQIRMALWVYPVAPFFLKSLIQWCILYLKVGELDTLLTRGDKMPWWLIQWKFLSWIIGSIYEWYAFDNSTRRYSPYKTHNIVNSTILKKMSLPSSVESWTSDGVMFKGSWKLQEAYIGVDYLYLSILHFERLIIRG